MAYTMKEFAELFQISEHTVRYYTDIQLLPCQRDAGNRRIFDEESVNWMRGILCLKNCGTPIRDMKKYFHLCRLEESEENLRARYEIILNQRELARKKAAAAKAAAEYMDYKVKHYEDILAGLTADDMNPNNWPQEARQPEKTQPCKNT
ncbi:MAG: MerR family transcriptional regulator [Lachnospiraceae bacterium]|jgi:DNA-binding transcriptional MerR regulator|nr:MerR family transcriptional regulator [Lachnospiraceae bacterium]